MERKRGIYGPRFGRQIETGHIHEGVLQLGGRVWITHTNPVGSYKHFVDNFHAISAAKIRKLFDWKKRNATTAFLFLAK